MSEISAAFIAEMKEKLLVEQTLLLKELGDIAHKQNGAYAANYPEYGEHEDENASEVTDFQALAATTAANEARLETITGALARIEAGTYGLTDDGQAIPEERLRANPAATTLVS